MRTQLYIGTMSKNVIDSAIGISKQLDIPIILIASRRQVDGFFLGNGYVMTTNELTDYVGNQKADKIYLARDHGGANQGNRLNSDVETAMKVAENSFSLDICAGFDYIHIDPTVPIGNEDLTIEIILERLFRLYTWCITTARTFKRDIKIEIGTEEQSGKVQDLHQLEHFLYEIHKFCRENDFPLPTYTVVQTGTKVKEMQNVGTFNADNIRQSIALCGKYNIMVKEHNADYLSDEALYLRPILGIHASNVAPEFGVTETKALLYLLGTSGYRTEVKRFIELALESKKWEKWMLPNSKATDLEKAMICGHYIFSHPEVIEMKEKAAHELSFDVDGYLRRKIQMDMMRYVRLFNML